jgi:hypothetical protein
MLKLRYNSLSKVEEDMGDRFYQQQLKKTGDCPGQKWLGTMRKKQQ